MGVPKFFRYISERYPCLSELAREQCIPDFDNLYLDMNGIIHTCSHPDDSDIHFTITEEEMFKDIFNYIEKLFFLIKPQKLFFMAVDGVAPRAKMNQQRSRRFRSAKDAEILESKALSRGEACINDRFDSNCITPGTEFMARLHEALKCFVRSKVSNDSLWKKCRVILSGQDYPGEGEHKIMDYIRYLKSQPNYNPNTRHCLYGLDADLIILGLCTHELHFVVLREEVKFGRKTKRTSVEQTRFFLLHLGLFREYLEIEFDDLKKQNVKLDITRIIDDWVLMGFLVGNDFVPNLPCLHINSNALPLLYKTYINVYSSLGGNINESGKLNLERLEKYFAALAEEEYKIFVENNDNLKYLESKGGTQDAFDFDTSQINNQNMDSELEDYSELSRQFYEENAFNSSDEEEQLVEEFEAYKRNYYMEKMNQNHDKSDSKKEQAICYIKALQWILDYYYRGVQSWDWYYPYHYAPFVSDLKGFKEYNITFNIGKPFLPFEQLLAVLPAASKKLLPKAYRDLMTCNSSELKDFYPNEFKTDLNGKQHEWEAVVLIPFIDEKKLLTAMEKCETNLTSEERARNKHGPMLQYDYSKHSQRSAPGAYSIKPLARVNCIEKPLWPSDIEVQKKLTCVELPNAYSYVFFPGFPTMKHLSYKFKIMPARVKVFEQPSRNESVILLPEHREELSKINTVAEKLLNEIVFIGWPHLIKTKVVAVSNHSHIINAEGIKNNDSRTYNLQKKEAESHLKTRMGIQLSDYDILVHVRTHIGTTLLCGQQGKVTTKDMWSQALTAYPAQGIVAQISVHSYFGDRIEKIEELFPAGSKVFFIGSPYFGSSGAILDPMTYYDCGRLSVRITVLMEPCLEEARQIQEQFDKDYVNSYQAAIKLGVSAGCIARVTGTILVISGERRNELPENIAKFNIGLQMRYVKQQEERAGFTRRINNQWFYSSKALDVIRAYYEKYPTVFSYLAGCTDRLDVCFSSDIFPENDNSKEVEEIACWIKSLPHMQSDRIACGSKSLDKGAVTKALQIIEESQIFPKKTVKLQVKPHLLLKPDITHSDLYKPKRAIQLFDRIVIVKTTYMVPIGSKGTVVGIQPVSDPNPVRMECIKAVVNFFEILFDLEIPNGNDIHGIAKNRVYKVPESSLLLIEVKDSNRVGSKIHQISPHRIENSQKEDNQTEEALPFLKAQGTIQCITAKENVSGSSGFWLPTANTKKKLEQLELDGSTNGFTINSQQNLVSSGCRLVETDALKSTLGLSIEHIVSKSEHQHPNRLTGQLSMLEDDTLKQFATNSSAPAGVLKNGQKECRKPKIAAKFDFPI